MDGFQSKLPAGIFSHGLLQVKEVHSLLTQVEQEKENPKKESANEKSHQRLWLNRLFICERWSCNCCVTSMNWSPQFPELLSASYNNNDDVLNGVYLFIWNTKFKKITPEFILHCQSPVISTTFARFHPNLILDIAGMAYFGQIVLFVLLDNRVQKKTPIQRTPHPVYCLNVVGIQIVHNLISISTDGKLCSWLLIGNDTGKIWVYDVAEVRMMILKNFS
ncbi:Cytoplasmic dynein 1 intermediate chain [Cyphomyrmex costatus]|uniref:Cytoplasmic dynein 1 intermediate chain n=1 Tax=Cyphomyrmex costatus TaxID=456900 RepID=A0A151INU9_9HYME|nr:Cytoplasmic dynein 1 intermediate chain [Cyphomyrmex costatus]